MHSKFLSEQLRDSEEVLLVVTRSPLAHAKGFFFSLLLIIASFFFLYPLLQLGRWGLLAFLAVLGVGVVLFIRTFILHRMNMLVLTSERILDIDQRRLFSRVVSECLYENIQEMSTEVTGVLGTSWRVGTLMIHTSGDRADLRVSGIKHPQKVQDVITGIQKKKNAHESGEQLSAHEFVDLLEKVKKHIHVEVPPASEKKKISR